MIDLIKTNSVHCSECRANLHVEEEREKLEIHYTSKHGSWLDIAEIELSALSLQGLGDKRIPDIDALNVMLSAWFCARNPKQKAVSWHFNTSDSRTKLKHLYPDIIM